MAIPFLNNITLNNNEIQNVRLHNTGASNAAAGQIFFNTGVNLAEYYANSIDQWVSLKEYSFGNGTYINANVTGTTAKPIITPDLSAIDGTPGASDRYLTKTNVWAEISEIPGTYIWKIRGDTGGPTVILPDRTVDFIGGTNVTTSLVAKKLTINSTNESITLTGDVTGAGTTSIVTAISAGAVNFAMLNPTDVITEAEGIENNDNDTTIPTSAAVKAYADSLIVGGLIYQGGYNATDDIPDLTTSPNNILKGWTYTVTVEGTFFGEQLRVGDVLIAEIDNPTTLVDWTTVQNNIDLADDNTVGIGNVSAGDAIDVTYLSGTATVSVEDSTASNKGAVIVAGGTGVSVAYSNGRATVTNDDSNSDNTYAVTITDTATITHGLGTKDVVIQLYDVTTNETVYADVLRVDTAPYDNVTITFASTPTNDIRVLVQKIG